MFRRFFTGLALSVVAATGLVAVSSRPASANERHFTYTYESAVLPRDRKELEVWTTLRSGRDRYYNAFDHSVEFEVGVTDRLMSAFYLHFGSTTATDQFGVRKTETEYRGISSEWKYRFLDPTADPIGFAAYLEFFHGPKETEIESKLIFDKRIGRFLFAANLVGEMEWEHGDEASSSGEAGEAELVADLDLGGAYFLTDHFSVGLEARNTNKFEEESWKFSSIFAGPVMAYSGDGWWVALTGMRQLGSPKGKTSGALNLADQERINVRLLFSFHI